MKGTNQTLLQMIKVFKQEVQVDNLNLYIKMWVNLEFKD